MCPQEKYSNKRKFALKGCCPKTNRNRKTSTALHVPPEAGNCKDGPPQGSLHGTSACNLRRRQGNDLRQCCYEERSIVNKKIGIHLCISQQSMATSGTDIKRDSQHKLTKKCQLRNTMHHNPHYYETPSGQISYNMMPRLPAACDCNANKLNETHNETNLPVSLREALKADYPLKVGVLQPNSAKKTATICVYHQRLATAGPDLHKSHGTAT